MNSMLFLKHHRKQLTQTSTTLIMFPSPCAFFIDSNTAFVAACSSAATLSDNYDASVLMPL